MKFPLLLSCSHAILSLIHGFIEDKSDSAIFHQLSLFARFWLARVKGNVLIYSLLIVVHHRCLLGNPPPTLSKQIHELHSHLEEEYLLLFTIVFFIHRVEAKKDETPDWFWLFIRVLIEKGVYYHYTFETEKANPIFMKAIRCMCFP